MVSTTGSKAAITYNSLGIFRKKDSTNAKGNYNVVYQFNIDAGNVGLQFKRKVEN